MTRSHTPDDPYELLLATLIAEASARGLTGTEGACFRDRLGLALTLHLRDRKRVAQCCAFGAAKLAKIRLDHVISLTSGNDREPRVGWDWRDSTRGNALESVGWAFREAMRGDE